MRDLRGFVLAVDQSRKVRPALVIVFVIWLFPSVAEAQAHSAQTIPQAKVLSGGVLSGWHGVFGVFTEPNSVVTFTCSNPVIVIGKKRVACVAVPESEGPQIVGSNGNLSSWHVDVRGDANFMCPNPVVNFSEQRILCPPQPAQERVAELESELQRTREELQALKAEKHAPTLPLSEPRVITIMNPPPIHSFACVAPDFDPLGEVLTCYEIVRLF